MNEREQEILTKTIDVLKIHVNPEKIYLFGSRAKGAHRKGSDFDFAVSGLKPEFAIRQKIETVLEKFTGLYQLDVVYLDSVEEDFRNLILEQGKVVYEK